MSFFGRSFYEEIVNFLKNDTSLSETERNLLSQVDERVRLSDDKKSEMASKLIDYVRTQSDTGHLSGLVWSLTLDYRKHLSNLEIYQAIGLARAELLLDEEDERSQAIRKVEDYYFHFRGE